MSASNQKQKENRSELGPRLRDWPLPGKVLITMIVVMMTIGLSVAAGQIIAHDIIPTFWGKDEQVMSAVHMSEGHSDTRGDLFDETLTKEKTTTFYQTDEFIFALKFTHIHIFGMSAIFILMGIIVLFLDLGIKVRSWLILLPFIGIIIDLTSVWLKIFVHPAFFWLHIPGGSLFGVVFVIDVVLILWQMWVKPSPNI
ncbi:MAG: hypothetical protein H8D96_12610 [Desulfobacterales bacterium]|uniref:Uncharacterized protein n=1 Tax=Candidatus Desulfatibia vada TaxID=2841696 RepID=A0A8J6P3A6_9BACT|nr:hypothetical protein [Candidatus Desulfatibia vada]MBL6970683.1 hypothetical protein [Desulfobacterales bacterium]